MTNSKNLGNLGKANPTKAKGIKHIPSKIQADTLFTFTTELEYLILTIKNKMVSPRYCKEDLRYLKLKELKQIACPMNCFCDINMHRLDEHLEWYGYYGLAFSKEWGMHQQIQPVQYINNDSHLCKDFSKAFSRALKEGTKGQSAATKYMKNYMLNQLMYLKPYSGTFKNRNTGKNHKKCFMDECEWRYVPDVTVLKYKQLYYDKNMPNALTLTWISNSLAGKEEVSLKYEYKDLKYVIVKTLDDFYELTDEIATMELDEKEERELISKIIIWEKSKGDF